MEKRKRERGRIKMDIFVVGLLTEEKVTWIACNKQVKLICLNSLVGLCFKFPIPYIHVQATTLKLLYFIILCWIL